MLTSNSLSICLTVPNTRITRGPRACHWLSFQAYLLFVSAFFWKFRGVDLGSMQESKGHIPSSSYSNLFLRDCVPSNGTSLLTLATQKDGKHHRLKACLGYRVSSQHVSDILSQIKVRR